MSFFNAVQSCDSFPLSLGPFDRDGGVIIYRATSAVSHCVGGVDEIPIGVAGNTVPAMVFLGSAWEIVVRLVRSSVSDFCRIKLFFLVFQMRM